LRTSPVLDDATRAAIEERLLRRRESAQELMARFAPEAFLPRLAAASRGEALRSLCEQLLLHPGVRPELLDAVLRRENRISTELGSNCAVAHSLVSVSERTTVGVAILRRPVVWRHGNVQVLFVVANGLDENYSFAVVSQLKDVLQSPQLVDRLVRGQVDDFTEFRELMLGHLTS
jgi:lichenan operon transcriptional antiterminator